MRLQTSVTARVSKVPTQTPPKKANYVNTFKQTFFFLDGNEKTAKMTVSMLDMSSNHSVKSRVSGSQRQGTKHYNNHQTHTHSRDFQTACNTTALVLTNRV